MVEFPLPTNRELDHLQTGISCPGAGSIARPTAEYGLARGGIILEWWARSSRNAEATSFRNGGRHHSGMVGGFTRNPHAKRGPVPVTGEAERPMPTARGKVDRRTEGK